MTDASPAAETHNFIRQKIDFDIGSSRVESVHTRFPPEPNGYLHIGHAKSICLNFGIARDYDGQCNLRFDDTNPIKEDDEYVLAIKEDLEWLGFVPSGTYFASDYFDQLYHWAIDLINKGLAYVDSQNADAMRTGRGTLTTPGTNSPDRERPASESLELLAGMKDGKHDDGQYVLRAKIDMAHPNMTLRDPAMYRIRNITHHRTGDNWHIYPMYDYAHGLSDAIEGITHSLCTLEFEEHRPLYDWFIQSLDLPKPRPEQTEFARLNLAHTVLSKRKLIELVEHNHVSGWDDPRMPTISGLRRRGVPAEALIDFCDRIGVARANSLVDTSLLNFCIRDHLNKTALRRMAILDPLRVTITNFETNSDDLQAANNPEDESTGTRPISFGRDLLVERADFLKEANKKWRRLTPGKEVRFLHGYYVTCDEVIEDDAGNPIELRCSYDPTTAGGWSDDGRKVKGTIHWLNADTAKPATVRMYDHLFTEEDLAAIPEDKSYLDYLNPDSLKEIEILVEPALSNVSSGEQFQFVRNGYFVADASSNNAKPVFNQTVGLRDNFANKQK